MTMFRRSVSSLLALLAALVLRVPLAAARPDASVSAGLPGIVVDLPNGRGEGELLRLDVRLVPALLALATEESTSVADWPVAPGVRRAVRLTRHEIWADGAKVFRVDASGRTELPRSPLRFFWGSDAEGAGSRVLVTLDPRTRAITALVHGPEGVNEIARDALDAAGRHLLAAPVRPPGATWSCAQEDFPDTAWLPGPSSARVAEGRIAAVLGSLYKAILAIDTDTEYLASFGNNTANATSHIATLVANINVMYERDLNLRLVIGTTILRTGSDPWTVTGSGASFPQLNEFTGYWNTNYPKSGTPRSFGALFSGKSTSGLSGIAWVANSVCGGGTDYSFNQISANGSWLFGDTLIVGHEIGHNMGSPHTHCYTNPAPDHCWANEACYSGPTSCPAAQTINGVTNVTGTIMSYCHQLGGCGLSFVFHPSTVSRYVGLALDAGAAAACIVPVNAVPPPPPVSAATTFNSVAPCRVLDTRNTAGPLGGPPIGAGGLRSFVVTGVCNVPADTVAISANVAAVFPAAAGDLLLYPNGIASPPTVSTLSFRAGRTSANNSLVYLASDGSFLVKNNAAGALDFVLDVNGYFK
ncbi:MAG: zinc-dependent metalloprotease [Thermoanaerobaculia bacterium]|nr:zinc-dependent metalloprotease [Thermoanaerobaculia bacterium]